MRVQRASKDGLGSIDQMVPNSKWPSKLYIGAYVRTKCTRQNSSRHVIELLHTEVVWHTSQSPHTIWCSPTRPHRDWRRDWLCDGDWTLGMGQSILDPYFPRLVPHSRTETGNSHARKFHFGMIYQLHCRCQAREALSFHQIVALKWMYWTFLSYIYIKKN